MRRATLIAVVAVLVFVLGLSMSAWTQERERHPHVRAAMKALQTAENQLKRGAHDFGGHRVKALELTQQAKKEIDRAIEWDWTHPEPPKKTQ